MNSSNIYVKEVFNVTQVELIQQSNCFCFNCDISVQSTLYFNGYQISDSRVNYTIQSGTIVLNISNATSKDFGVYEGIFTACTIKCGPLYFDTFFSFSLPPYDLLKIGGTFRVQIYGMSNNDVTACFVFNLFPYQLHPQFP
jgi:hypothetical protein